MVRRLINLFVPVKVKKIHEQRYLDLSIVSWIDSKTIINDLKIEIDKGSNSYPFCALHYLNISIFLHPIFKRNILNDKTQFFFHFTS